MTNHKDLPSGSQRWARELDNTREQVKHLTRVVQRLTGDMALDYSDPKRGLSSSAVPSVQNPVQLKLSSLQDLSVRDAQEGDYLKWDGFKWVTGRPPGTEDPVPEPILTPDAFNLFPDPRFRSITGDQGRLMYNYHTKPTPTFDLSGWETVGGASMSREAASSLVGLGYGVRVNSPSATDGVLIPPLVNTVDRPGISVYIRAETAMTITVDLVSQYTMSFEAVGWGDMGWGEPIDYTPGTRYSTTASYTFAAGEVKRFRAVLRMTPVSEGGTRPPYDSDNPELLASKGLKITGQGQFSVDGIQANVGVSDGGYDDIADAELDRPIPNFPLFFCGDTPDTADHTYSWVGEPYNSPSVLTGARLKYITNDNTVYPDTEAFATLGTSVYAATLPDGNTGAAILSTVDFSSNAQTYFASNEGDKDLRPLGLEQDKSYVLSFDLVSPYTLYYAPDPDWNGEGIYIYSEGQDDKTYFGVAPGSTRIVLAIRVGTDPVMAYISQYLSWLSGRFFITNVMLEEKDVLLVSESLPPVEQKPTPPYYMETRFEYDLLAGGCVPGKSYTASSRLTPIDSSTAEWAGIPPTDLESMYLRAEYQDGSGSWKLLDEDKITDNYRQTQFTVNFTVPENTTQLRLAGFPTDNWGSYTTLTESPTPFFDGDSVENDNYKYAWAGTPHESPSIRYPKQ